MLFACDGMSLPGFPFVQIGCIALHMAAVSMSLLMLMPSGHGLLLVSAIFSHLLFCNFLSLPSLACSYP